MLKTSWSPDQIISEWSSTSQMLTDASGSKNIYIFQAYFLALKYYFRVRTSCKLICNGRVASLCGFSLILVYTSGLVFCLIFFPVCRPWHMGTCWFEQGFLQFLVACPYLFSVILNSIWQTGECFLENTIYISDFFFF